MGNLHRKLAVVLRRPFARLADKATQDSWHAFYVRKLEIAEKRNKAMYEEMLTPQSKTLNKEND